MPDHPASPNIPQWRAQKVQGHLHQAVTGRPHPQQGVMTDIADLTTKALGHKHAMHATRGLPLCAQT